MANLNARDYLRQKAQGTDVQMSPLIAAQDVNKGTRKVVSNSWLGSTVYLELMVLNPTRACQTLTSTFSLRLSRVLWLYLQVKLIKIPWTAPCHRIILQSETLHKICHSEVQFYYPRAGILDE